MRFSKNSKSSRASLLVYVEGTCCLALQPSPGMAVSKRIAGLLQQGNTPLLLPGVNTAFYGWYVHCCR